MKLYSKYGNKDKKIIKELRKYEPIGMGHTLPIVWDRAKDYF
jgi:single-stranded DNA-specific DHH superfamily exonuclease